MASDPRDSLLDMLRALEAMEEHVAACPLEYTRWTVPQVEYLSRASRRKMLRTGNRFGKSKVALGDVVYRARKAHPYRPDWNRRRGALHQAIVGVSWDQLIPHMRTFKGMLGRDELASAPNFSFRKGWGKDSPCLVWPDGSSVTWKTTGQDELAQAGAEYDHALIDEPCESETYREFDRRVSSRAGDLSIVLTPINAPAPLDWLEELAAEGIVDDMHYRLEERHLRFADTGELRRLPDGTVMDTVWIEAQEREVLARWRDIILHGEWNEVDTEGVFARSFSPEAHVAAFRLDGKEVLVLGLDHGTKAFTETAVLLAVDERGEYPAVYILDLYEAPENTPPEKDAEAIVAMLGHHGLRWRDLARATGDIAHHGGRGKLGRKSNAELSYELAKVLGLRRHEALAPPIWTAKTGQGAAPRDSVRRGLEWMHRAMIRPGHFTIHPRCVSLIEAIPRFRGGSEDPYGHLVDAVRYGLDQWIRRGQTRRVPDATMTLYGGR